MELKFDREVFVYVEVKEIEKIVNDFVFAKVFDINIKDVEYVGLVVDGERKELNAEKLNRIYMFPFDEENYKDTYVEISKIEELWSIELTIAGKGRIEYDGKELIIYPKIE